MNVESYLKFIESVQNTREILEKPENKLTDSIAAAGIAEENAALAALKHEIKISHLTTERQIIDQKLGYDPAFPDDDLSDFFGENN